MRRLGEDVDEEEEMGSDLDGMAPTPNRRRLANDSALTASLQAGCCIFFQFFDYAINNAYLLYKHLSCSQIECKGFARFWLELVHLFLEQKVLLELVK